MRNRVLIAATTVTVAVLVTLAAGSAVADESQETTVLKNASRATFLANATYTYGTFSLASWVDTASSGELVTYPAPGKTGPLVVGSTCIPRDQNPLNGGLIGSQPAGDLSTCMRFAAEQTSSGTFTFRVDEPGMPADGRYLGDGDSGGFLDLLSTTPLTQFIITPRPAISVQASAGPTTASLAVGTDVQFRFAVTNTGNVDLTGLTLASLAFDGTGTPGALTCDVAALAPGAQASCVTDYTLTATDTARTDVRMTASATAADPSGTPVSSEATAVLALTTSAPQPRTQLAATGVPTAPAASSAIALAAIVLTGALMAGSAVRRRMRTSRG